jgi:hypothetical protein
MLAVYRLVLPVAAVLAFVSTAVADGIEAGLWKIISSTETGGVTSPQRESAKCLTADMVQDLPTTFSPAARTVNSECAPMERHFDGKKLTWHLVCTGTLNMDLTGGFEFDSSRHYVGAVHSVAVMGGQTMVNSLEMLEGQWVSECK